MRKVFIISTRKITLVCVETRATMDRKISIKENYDQAQGMRDKEDPTWKYQILDI